MARYMCERRVWWDNRGGRWLNRLGGIFRSGCHGFLIRQQGRTMFSDCGHPPPNGIIPPCPRAYSNLFAPAELNQIEFLCPIK